MTMLQDYFQRIGFTGSPAADLSTLREIHRLHPAAIPFENIDVLAGDGIDLAMDRIVDKLIGRGRGGYCFEQNWLLMTALRELGFDVEPLMARVVWQQPVGAPAGPKTHLVLRTLVDGEPWLVDVGFGGMVLTAPLILTPDLQQPTPHETFRLIEQRFGYQLEVLLSQQWQPVYQLSMEPQQPIDIEVANWYTAAHPNSKFRHHLMAARVTDETRYTLLNNRLAVRHQGQPADYQLLDTAGLARVLEEQFLLPVSDDWFELLQRQVEIAQG